MRTADYTWYLLDDMFSMSCTNFVHIWCCTHLCSLRSIQPRLDKTYKHYEHFTHFVCFGWYWGHYQMQFYIHWCGGGAKMDSSLLNHLFVCPLIWKINSKQRFPANKVLSWLWQWKWHGGERVWDLCWGRPWLWVILLWWEWNPWCWPSFSHPPAASVLSQPPRVKYSQNYLQKCQH